MGLTTKQIKQWVRRVLISSLICMLLQALVLVAVIRQNFFSHLSVFIQFWTLSVASLYFLSRLVADLIQMMADENASKAEHSIGAMVWGFLKFATLGITVWRMIQTTEEFGLALALGVGTLFVVPMSSALMHKWKRI